jgi:fumarate hydratase subunit beta
MEYRMRVPLNPADLSVLRAGDVVYLTGAIYTARDAAHARFDALLENGECLPIPKGACIYYCGPCPEAPVGL